MAVLTANKPSSAHWYAPDGDPKHRMPTADGERATTLRDARKMGLYPSVTSILGILAKPGLDTWKQNQVALSALANPKGDEESEEYWVKRVREAAFEQVEEAADMGTRIHAALEAGMNGEEFDPELSVYVEPVLEWRDKTGIVIVERELRLVNQAHGFAGTSDVFFRYGEAGIGILDYKTRKTKPGEVVKAYDGQAMQLAAYAATYWGEEDLPRVLAANVFISTTEPGRFEVVKHADLGRHWDAFRMAASLWRYLNDYDPRQGPQAQPPKKKA